MNTRIAPIVDAATLRALQTSNAGPLVVADVRWYLDGRSGPAAYETGHIPGAVFVDLPNDLSDHTLDSTAGRHPFPTAEHFGSAMGRLGIGDDSIVVAYDDAGGSTAGRLVFMLRIIGREASLLDGGLQAWGNDTESGPGRSATPATFTAVAWPAERFADADEMGVDDPAVVVLDARSNDRFRGENEVVDPRAGHIPYARNAPWGDNTVAAGGVFKSADELREQFAAVGVVDGSSVVCYCGSGVSACNDLLALEHIGITDTRLFVPSWSGWSADPARPVAIGPA